MTFDQNINMFKMLFPVWSTVHPTSPCHLSLWCSMYVFAVLLYHRNICWPISLCYSRALIYLWINFFSTVCTNPSRYRLFFWRNDRTDDQSIGCITREPCMSGSWPDRAKSESAVPLFRAAWRVILHYRANAQTPFQRKKNATPTSTKRRTPFTQRTHTQLYFAP